MGRYLALGALALGALYLFVRFRGGGAPATELDSPAKRAMISSTGQVFTQALGTGGTATPQ